MRIPRHALGTSLEASPKAGASSWEAAATPLFVLEEEEEEE
jgi:hypothetical protein